MFRFNFDLDIDFDMTRNIHFLREDDNQQDLELEELDLASYQSAAAHCLDPHFQLQVMQITAHATPMQYQRRKSTSFCQLT